MNTAMSSSWDFKPVPPNQNPEIQSTGFFTSGVGLMEILNGAAINTGRSTEGDKLFLARLNGANIGQVGIYKSNTFPYTDAGVMRNDFKYWSLGDAFESQLSRRVTNVGRWGASPANIYKAVGSADASAVSFRSGLVNANASSTDLETNLQTSL